MDFDNNPITNANNVLENFEVTGSHLGVVIGSTSTSAVSGASCASNFNQSGCSENDFVTINNFQISGTVPIPRQKVSEFNSLNAIQGSIIGGGNIQCANIGLHVINMNDNAQLTRMNLGSVLGTNSTLVLIESSVVNGPDIIRWRVRPERGSYRPFVGRGVGLPRQPVE